MSKYIFNVLVRGLLIFSMWISISFMVITPANAESNYTDPSLVKGDFLHGMTTCKTCHAPSGYHQKGAAGLLGEVENILKKMNG